MADGKKRIFYLNDEGKVISCTYGRCLRSKNAGASKNGCWNCQKKEKCAYAGTYLYRDCGNCINKDNKKFCRTMMDKPDELFCWADQDMAIKRETDIINYTRKKREAYAPKTSEYQICCYVIVHANENIKMLSKK